MNLTKDQISDLRSHIDNIVRCSLAKERETTILAPAKASLENFLWKLEHDKGENNA